MTTPLFTLNDFNNEKLVALKPYVSAQNLALINSSQTMRVMMWSYVSSEYTGRIVVNSTGDAINAASYTPQFYSFGRVTPGLLKIGVNLLTSPELFIDKLSHELGHFIVESPDAVIANARSNAFAAKDASAYASACNLTEGYAESATIKGIDEISAVSFADAGMRATVNKLTSVEEYQFYKSILPALGEFTGTSAEMDIVLASALGEWNKDNYTSISGGTVKYLDYCKRDGNAVVLRYGSTPTDHAPVIEFVDGVDAEGDPTQRISLSNAGDTAGGVYEINNNAKTSTLRFDDGSSITITQYADGHSASLTSDRTGVVYQQSTTTWNSDRSASDTVILDGAGNIQTRIKTDYHIDDYGNTSRTETIVNADGTVQNTYDKDGMLFKSEKIESGANNISDAVAATASFLALIKAIQTGQPLPILSSGVNTLIALQKLPGAGGADINLSGTGAALSALVSLYSLQKNIEAGDTLGAITAGAQTFSFGATAYANLANHAGLASGSFASQLNTSLSGGHLANGTPLGDTPLVYLSLVNDIAHGNGIGVALDVLAIAYPPAAPFLLVANLVFGGLFDSPPPRPWGIGRYVWNADGSVGISASGDHGGDSMVQSTLQSFLSSLQGVTSHVEGQGGSPKIGIVASRLASLSFNNGSFALNDIDPVTGVDRTIHYDSSGHPVDAKVGSPEYFRNMGEQFIYSALAREAIAPQWEVDTARLQAQAGDPQAGLTELQRAQRNGQLAAAPDQNATAETWRPILLDLNGDGVRTISQADAQVAFDVDSTGFFKSTAWASKQDGFLVLDRNYNSLVDNGLELFSNSAVAGCAKGPSSMYWFNLNVNTSVVEMDIMVAANDLIFRSAA